MIASILIFAATLSSPELGTFFTLPAWMPKAVQSVHTPGSADYDGSHRIGSNELAAVNAAFEGLYERMYFAGQGQTNDWGASYGPLTARQFRFDLPSGSAVFNYQPTNRVIATRRFVEWANLDGLSDWILGTLSKNGFRTVSMRPNWSGYEVGGNISHVWWSTTALSPFADCPIVPEFDWTFNPTATYRSQWQNCCMCFGCLDSDAVWQDVVHYSFRPCQGMLEKLSFGQLGWAYYECYPHDVDKTFGELIETAWPGSDGCAITNDTRRLYVDRLACVDRTLGLMDRTYHEPSVTYPTTGTNINFQNEVTWHGTASVDIAWNSQTCAYELAHPGGRLNAGYQQGVERNRQLRSSVSSSGSAVHFRITDTQSAGSVAMSGTIDEIVSSEMMADLAIIMSGDMSECDFLLEMMAANLDEYGQVILFFSLYDITGGGWTLLWTGTTQHWSGTYDEAPIEGDATFMRQYTHARTIGSAPIVGPVQVGWQGGSRRESSSYGAVVGDHRFWSPSASLASVEWSGGDDLKYKSSTSGYASKGALVSALSYLLGECTARTVAAYGFAADDWQHIIPIDASIAETVRDSAVVNSITVSVVHPGYPEHSLPKTYVIGRKIGTSWSPTRVYSIVNDVEVEDWTTLARVEARVGITCSTSAQSERPGIGSDAKVGVLTRTDWSWNALRLTVGD